MGGLDKLTAPIAGRPLLAWTLAAFDGDLPIERVAVVVATFDWNDVGSWAAIPALWGTDGAGNAARGKTLLVECRDTLVHGSTRLVAVLGVNDLVVVDSPDAVLVCPRDRAQDVRRIVDALGTARLRRFR